MYSCGLLTERSQGPRPPLSLSKRACAVRTRGHTRRQTHTHTNTEVRGVGLAEISLMTLGRENDASSSSHPEPLLSAPPSGNTPGTCHHPSNFSLACGSALPVGRRQPGLQPRLQDKAFPFLFFLKSEKDFRSHAAGRHRSAGGAAGFSGRSALKKSFKKLAAARVAPVIRRVVWSACRGIIWLMTVEFPYLITNWISAPLEVCGEESDEWQGSTQWPKRDSGWKTEGGKKRTRVNPEPYLSLLPFSAALRNSLFFRLWLKKPIPPPEIGRCLLVGS